MLPSASLVPDETDPSVLFNTAGMQPLVPYLMGKEHPQGKRLASAQKCIRTDDIDEVGDKVHHTFFEMLGNWSLGDYFKSESIDWSWEFLTHEEWLGFDKSKLAVSVFEGDDDAPFDQEAYDKWLSLGINTIKIAKLPKKNNWWGPAGATGPCGPDTEIFYWTGAGEVPTNFQETCDYPSWVEVWNNVFMQYNKTIDGKFDLLEQKNVDTGMGFERTLAVINGLDDNYETDLFKPIIEKIEEISGKKYKDNQHEFRIISDHLKAATFAIGDGAIPSNKGAGYIVRRLIRRAIVKAKEIGIEANFTDPVARKIFEIYKDSYEFREESTLSELEKEENKFRKTLKEGLRLLEQKTAISGQDLFDLYQSYGLPVEISTEEAKRSGREINNEAMEQYSNLLKKHQDLSRTASAGMFKGGLVEAGEMTTRYHTATHLLLAALRQLISPDIYQKGSNIIAERLRLDFNYQEKLTPEQIKSLEDLVNEKIAEDLPVTMAEMSVKEAKDSGAMGIFDSKYGDKVKVYTIGGGAHSTRSDRSGSAFSREICGGPHVTHTGELGPKGAPFGGHFKITKEESSSAGVRRIKAVLE